MSIEINPERLRQRAELIRQYQAVLPRELPVLLSESARQIEALTIEKEQWKQLVSTMREVAIAAGLDAIDVYGDGYGEPSINGVLELTLAELKCTRTTN